MGKTFTIYLVIFLFNNSYPTNYYLDKDATGLNNGTSWTNAWSLFSKINWNLIQPGDTLFISGGKDSIIYNEQLTLEKSGKLNLPIVISRSEEYGHNGRIIVRTPGSSRKRGILAMEKRYFQLRGIEITGSDTTLVGNVLIDQCSNFVLENLIIYADSKQGGIYLEYDTSFVVKNCIITTPQKCYRETDGIYSQENVNGAFIGNQIFLRNSIYNDVVHADGIQSYQDQGMTFSHNKIFNESVNLKNEYSCLYATTMRGGNFKYLNNLLVIGNARYSIGIGLVKNGGRVDSLIIYGNTVIANGDESYRLYDLEGFASPRIKNNIAYSPKSIYAAIFNGVTDYASIDYNCWYTKSTNVFEINNSDKTFNQWKALGADVHGINKNPLFVSDNDFALQPLSPCVDAGVNLGSNYDKDLLGISRPQGNKWDIGAYEFSNQNQDIVPPELVSVKIIDSVTVVLTFSEPLENNTVNNKVNYFINNDIVINNISVSTDGQQVTVLCSEHKPDIRYTISVFNLKDLAGNLISSTHNSYNYFYRESITTQPIKFRILDASASQWYLNYTPDKSIDGFGSSVADSRWGGAKPMPDTISYDLGEIRKITQTKVSFYNWDTGRKYRYKILASQDGITYQEILSETWSDAIEWNIQNITPQSTRFIKLISLENNESVFAGVWEFEVLGVQTTDVDPDFAAPRSFELFQNYPNPFNPTTTINFIIALRVNVSLKLYDLLGSEVAELVNGEKEPGNYKFTFNGDYLPSGVYFYKLQAGSFIETKKMILLK